MLKIEKICSIKIDKNLELRNFSFLWIKEHLFHQKRWNMSSIVLSKNHRHMIFKPQYGWQWCWWHHYVGDIRCWWQNHYIGDFFRYVGDFLDVLNLICCDRFTECPFAVKWSLTIKLITNILNRSPTSQTCHQQIWSPTFVTNIDVTLNMISRFLLPWPKSIPFGLFDIFEEVPKLAFHYSHFLRRNQIHWNQNLALNMECLEHQNHPSKGSRNRLNRSNLIGWYKDQHHFETPFWKKSVKWMSDPQRKFVDPWSFSETDTSRFRIERIISLSADLFGDTSELLPELPVGFLTFFNLSFPFILYYSLIESTV